MRTIKFRVWEHHNNKFTNNPIGFGLNNNFELSIPNDSFDGEIWKFTYQQYTGFKDRNGKDIYEGDILDRDDMYAYHMVVEWKDGYWSPIVTSNSSGLVVMTDIYMKIIGNIYENPELLK